MMMVRAVAVRMVRRVLQQWMTASHNLTLYDECLLAANPVDLRMQIGPGIE